MFIYDKIFKLGCFQKYNIYLWYLLYHWGLKTFYFLALFYFIYGLLLFTDFKIKLWPNLNLQVIHTINRQNINKDGMRQYWILARNVVNLLTRLLSKRVLTKITFFRKQFLGRL